MNQVPIRQKQRKAELRERLEVAREKTLRLLADVPDEHLTMRVHDFYSPIGWHFGHIGMTEEQWTLVQALGLPCLDDELAFLFANLADNPKDNRTHLPDRDAIIAYLAATHEGTLAALETTDLDTGHPLIADGYAWEFAHQHECQHQETIAELRQLLAQRTVAPLLSQAEAERVLNVSNLEESVLPRSIGQNRWIEIPGGTFRMGSDERHCYDNEKNPHSVYVAPFRLEKLPVTAVRWTEFIANGGYARAELWSPEGWQWRTAESIELPEYWFRSHRGYGIYCSNGVRGIEPFEPVSSISWYEADAFARWSGGRLPTEAEWEYAARFDPATGESRIFPWGNDSHGAAQTDCNQERSAPKPLNILEEKPDEESGKKAVSANAFGLFGMAGGIWEWTSSPFVPYPGFEAFPYDGYSKEHMDGRHFVCRGGSWATDPCILRSSFRNWYLPTYRQGFLGLRCAK